MKLGRFLQKVGARTRHVDYCDWLAEGEVLTAVAYTVDQGSATVDTTSIEGGNTTVFFLNGGDLGDQFNVIIRYTTSFSQIRFDHMEFFVEINGGPTVDAENQSLMLSIVGPAGPSGPTGAGGSAGGPTGNTGPSGNKGDTGSGGATGATGPTGDKGDTGSGGTAGAAGTTGNTGPIGATGPTGDKGDTGSGGAPGAPGAGGTAGATGPTGNKGDTGSGGTAGATGPTGSAGSGGTAGATGATGAGASLANPSATVGLTAVNGAATTAMRSDGAPAIDTAIVKGQPIAENWFFGDSGNTTLTGTQNTGLGYRALAALTSGNYNSGFGALSLYSLQDGQFNMGFGLASLQNSVSDYYNIAIGYAALHQCVGGSGNFAAGFQAGYDITTGGSNLLIGYNTGRGIDTGSNNTVIGANVTGLSATLAGAIIFANGAGTILLDYGKTTAARWSVHASVLTLYAAAASNYFIVNTDALGGYAAFVQYQAAGAGVWALGRGTADGSNQFELYNYGRSAIDLLVDNTTGAVSLAATTASTSTTTGALTVAGGVGVAGNIYTGGHLYDTVPTANARGDAAYTLVIGDAWNEITFALATTARVLTVPTNASVGFLIGTVIYVTVTAGTTGVLTISGAGVVIRGNALLNFGTVGGDVKGVMMLKVATNTWIIV